MTTQTFVEEIAQMRTLFPQAVIAYALRLGGAAGDQRRSEIIQYLQSQAPRYVEHSKTRSRFERSVISIIKEVSRVYSQSTEKTQGNEEQMTLGNLEEHFQS